MITESSSPFISVIFQSAYFLCMKFLQGLFTTISQSWRILVKSPGIREVKRRWESSNSSSLAFTRLLLCGGQASHTKSILNVNANWGTSQLIQRLEITQKNQCLTWKLKLPKCPGRLLQSLYLLSSVAPVFPLKTIKGAAVQFSELHHYQLFSKMQIAEARHPSSYHSPSPLFLLCKFQQEREGLPLEEQTAKRSGSHRPPRQECSPWKVSRRS